MKMVEFVKKWKGGFFAFMAIAVLVLSPTLSDACWPPPPAGTKICATKTATGFYESQIVYDWSIEKSVEPTAVEIPLGQPDSVTYTITTERTVVSEIPHYGVRGEICVKNIGPVPTKGLKIIDVVQIKSGYYSMFKNHAYYLVDVSAKPNLNPGETYCYPYELTFAPVPGATYRNKAIVTISNYSGWLPGNYYCPGTKRCPFGHDAIAYFSLPTLPSTKEIDAKAVVKDEQICPAGFTCTPSDPGPWSFIASGSVSFTKTINNVSAECGQRPYLNNTATLMESDTKEVRTDSAQLVIYTGDCEQTPPGGFKPGDYCTYTQGGWGARPHGNNPGKLLADNFTSVYDPPAVEVGIPGDSGFSMIFQSASAIEDYLPAGGQPNPLTKDHENPENTESGVFGGQVLALQLNVDFSVPGPLPDNLGSLKLCNTGTSLDGKTVAEILDAANTALGGGALPSGFTYSTLNNLVDMLNQAFDNCYPSEWANGTIGVPGSNHLCK